MSDKKQTKKKILETISQDWEVKKIKDISKNVFAGATPSTRKIEYWDGDIPWMSSGEINNKFIWDTEKCITKEGFNSSSTKMVPKNSVLIALAGQGKTRGKVAMNKIELCTNQSLASIVPKKNVDPMFLFYNLESRYNELRRLSTGDGGRGGLNLNIINNIYVSFPPLKEQQKIVSILSTWDKVIDLKEKLIEQKKEQKKGLMQKLLTGEVRLPGFDGEWKEVRLEQVVRKAKGKAIKYSKSGKYPAIDMDYLETGAFKNYSNDCSVFANEQDVLLLWDGSGAGKAFTGVKGTVGSTFVKLECVKINNIFLQKHLELNELRIQKLREGSGIPHVPKDFLSYYKIELPSKQEQVAIAKIMIQIDRNINLLEMELKNLKYQKKGLMQLLLTGKVRVKV